jgi:hypothetical protein
MTKTTNFPTSKGPQAVSWAGNATIQSAADGTGEEYLDETSENYPIIVHSHLHWDWVWQRPQQFLSRLSKKHPILFVEEPSYVDGISAPRAVLREVSEFPNLTVVRTEYPHGMNDREVLDLEQKRFGRWNPVRSSWPRIRTAGAVVL